MDFHLLIEFFLLFFFYPLTLAGLHIKVFPSLSENMTAPWK